MKRPRILLTNDDGVYAPGMQRLWSVLHKADIAELYIVAPAQDRSGTGVSLTCNRPMAVQRVSHFKNTLAWSVDGTPADCVKMGIRILLEEKPDLIVSGINAGSNAGRNVLHSGTIGATIEGVLGGIPGIAFSCENVENPLFSIIEPYLVTLIRYMFHHPLSSGTILNVNAPHVPEEEVQGIRWTRQGKGRWVEDPFLHTESSQGTSYWLGSQNYEVAEIDDCDISLLRKGYITVVPLHVHELTDRQELQKHHPLFEHFVAAHP